MENLAWGLQITVLGMGLVFGLLALLWGLLTLVLALDKEPTPVAAPQPTADEAVGEQTPEQPTVNGMPPDLVAAIMIATLKHKQVLRRQAAPFMRSYWPGSQLFASRWVAAGRARQNSTWQARGKK